MQVFGQLEPSAISCLQQSLAAGFEGSYTLFMKCSQMQKCCFAWRVGWGGLFLADTPILFSWEKEDSLRVEERWILW